MKARDLSVAFTLLAILIAAFPAIASSVPPEKIDVEITEIMPTVHRTAPPHKAKPRAKVARSYHRVVKPAPVAAKPAVPPTPATAPITTTVPLAEPAVAPPPQDDTSDPVNPVPSSDAAKGSGDGGSTSSAQPTRSKSNGE
jgi:hypothetical protein